MASYTPNINLKKPTTDEYYNVLDENQNKDKIDTAIGTLNSQFANLGTSTASTKDGMIADACTAFISLGINNIPLPVRIAWSGHDYYIGTMQKTSGNIVNYTLSTTDDVNSGRYNNGTVTNNGINDKLTNIVRSGSVSGQTDSTGDINVQLSASSYIPIAFKVTGGNMPTTAPRMFFQTSQGTGWFIKFINDSTLQNIANTTVEGTIYYLPI